MGLTVQNNNSALNSCNNLNKSSRAQQKSMKKLASGFKINSASDDASGLAISEKMRNQITALDTVVDSCEDGANLLQTAEGNIAEIQDMITRMVELAEESANGILDDDDRDALQDEMNELCAEVDRIASTANFNGTKLLNGDVYQRERRSVFTETLAVQFILPTGGFMNGKDEDGTVSKVLEYLKDNPSEVPSELSDNIGKVTRKYEYLEWTSDGEKWNAKLEGYLPIDPADECPPLKDYLLYFHKDGTPIVILEKDAAEPAGYNGTDWVCAKVYPANKPSKEVISDETLEVDTLHLKIGETSTKPNLVRFDRPNLHSDVIFNSVDTEEVIHTSSSSSATGGTLGGGVNHYGGTGYYKTTEVIEEHFIPNPVSSYSKGIAYDIRTPEKALKVYDHARSASEKISRNRGSIGALQNRLDYSINSATAASENTAATKSRIKDTDMAEEFTEYTSKSIISQASQSMLAQANTHVQDVLSLLQQQ